MTEGTDSDQALQVALEPTSFLGKQNHWFAAKDL